MRRYFEDGDPGASNALPVDAVAPLARRALDRLASEVDTATVCEEFLDGFCRLLRSRDASGAERVLRAMTASRAGAAALADGILAAAARHLGEQWDRDDISFAEVSIAMTRLARLRQVHVNRTRPMAPPRAANRVVFATLPGQAHNLGLVLAAEAFRQADWDVTLFLDMPAAEIVDRARRIRPRTIGFSLSRADRAHHVRPLIEQVVAFPFRARILVGGGAAPEFVASFPRAWNVHAVTDITSALSLA